MKTLGILGGIGPESTIEYYRLLISSYREQIGDGSYPAILLTSLDVNKLLAWMEASQLSEVTNYLAKEVERLARAGADFALIAANTPHIVFDSLQSQSPIPLISIVEATCAAAKAGGMTRVGLLGTRFTMQASFYPDVFAREGMTLVTPNQEDQVYIHHIYVNELLQNIFLPETRERLLNIIRQMGEEPRVEGVALAGTELPLILQQKDVDGVPLLDTTRIHVAAAVQHLLA